VQEQQDEEARKKTCACTTPLTGPHADLESTGDFASDLTLGSIIQAMDTVGKDYVATVVGVRPDSVCVHYMGWPDSWNEWIDRTSARLQPRGPFPLRSLPLRELFATHLAKDGATPTPTRTTIAPVGK
jgi:hypothetical protein